LGELFNAWLGVDFEDKTSLNILYEELLHLFEEGGLLSHLFLSHVEVAAERIVLPLLYADIERNALAGYLLKTVIFKHVQGHNGETSTMFAGSQLVAMLVTAPRDDLPLSAVEVLATLARQGHLRVEVPGCERFLVDGYPLVLYHILTSSSAQRVPEGDARTFISHKLHQLLEHTARALGKALHKEQPGGEGIMGNAQLHEVLSALVWDLGALDEEVSLTASKALSVLCFLVANRAWRVPRVEELSAAQLTEQMADCTASLLSDHFLFLMSNVLRGDQHLSSQNQQVRCLRCIRALTERVRQSDLSKYLPKVQIVC
jgi:hypothetical protein